MWISNPTGGLFYHIKALRYRRSLWKGFQSQIEKFQSEWLKAIPHANRKHLVLVGGSGGYSQSQDFLKNFETLIHIDIDPWASFFFKRNHPYANTRFYRETIFDHNYKIKSEFLTDYDETNSTWMWCNLLGQMGLTHSEDLTQSILRNIQIQMKNYSWMSFHDIYSFEAPKNLIPSALPTEFDSPEQIRSAIQKLPIKKVALADHLTIDRFQFDKRTLMLWPLTRKHYHFVEAGFSGACAEQD